MCCCGKKKNDLFQTLQQLTRGKGKGNQSVKVEQGNEIIRKKGKKGKEEKQ